MAGTKEEVEALDWDTAEKFYWLDGALRIIAERAMDYSVVAFRLVKADETEEIEKYKPHYNGSVPMLIANVRYLCFYKIDEKVEG